MNDLLKTKGVAFYACVHTPNKMAEKYTIDLSVTEAEAKKLKALGLTPAKTADGELKAHEEGKKVFKFKRNVVLPSGDELGPPKVYIDGKRSTELVGNGSEVEVAFTIYEGKVQGRAFVSTNLLGVKVTKHVPYETVALFDDVSDDVEEVALKTKEDDGDIEW